MAAKKNGAPALKDGGPAFPVSTLLNEEENEYGHQDSGCTWQFGGMTLKDYFAAQAMQGLLAYYGNPSHRYDELAMSAYTFAEAMLDERDKR